MKDLSNRISRLTHELRALRLQLQWDTFENSTPKDKDQLVDQVVSTGLVADLKTVVDEMNQFLWSYIDSAARNSGPDVDYAMQSARLNEVTEMLRILRQTSCPSSGAQLEFVARVTIAVDRQLQDTDEQQAVRRSA
jgi:exonuclease III